MIIVAIGEHTVNGDGVHGGVGGEFPLQEL